MDKQAVHDAMYTIEKMLISGSTCMICRREIGEPILSGGVGTHAQTCPIRKVYSALLEAVQDEGRTAHSDLQGLRQRVERLEDLAKRVTAIEYGLAAEAPEVAKAAECGMGWKLDKAHERAVELVERRIDELVGGPLEDPPVPLDRALELIRACMLPEGLNGSRVTEKAWKDLAELEFAGYLEWVPPEVAGERSIEAPMGRGAYQPTAKAENLLPLEARDR